MQKQAPTLGRLLVMVGFALSCVAILLLSYSSSRSRLVWLPTSI